MTNPKSPEDALNQILEHSKERTTQAIAARGLATTEAGQQILKDHIQSDDLPKHHVSFEATLKEAGTPSDKASEVKNSSSAERPHHLNIQ